MAAGRMRSTRRLRSWIVDQVNSGKYSGLVWDDDAKTMFRIPWKHAGKQDFRKDEDAAIFKAWAQFKGKLTDEELNNPASWKTRLRCALNKSPEFCEVNERSQLDISEPYKVYRLVPINEQGVPVLEKKCRVKGGRKQKRRSSSSSDSDAPILKQIKTEASSPQSHVQSSEDVYLPCDIPVQSEETFPSNIPNPSEELDEITLDVRIEESVPPPQADQDSFRVEVHYLGQEVVRQQVSGSDVRILYLPSAPIPPSGVPLGTQFPRVTLPDPQPSLGRGEELQALHTLLPFMEQGVVLTSTKRGVYGKRFCRGRVFWTGPHSDTGLHKMERKTEPVLLFSKEAFKQQLDDFCANGGERPQCSFMMCFGEELSEAEDPTKKLIIVQKKLDGPFAVSVQICLPWAEQQVENFESIVRTVHFLQTLADQSPMREITLDLVPVPSVEA